MVVIGAHVPGYLSIGKPPVAVRRGKEGTEHVEDSGLLKTMISFSSRCDPLERLDILHHLSNETEREEQEERSADPRNDRLCR